MNHVNILPSYKQQNSVKQSCDETFKNNFLLIYSCSKQLKLRLNGSKSFPYENISAKEYFRHHLMKFHILFVQKQGAGGAKLIACVTQLVGNSAQPQTLTLDSFLFDSLTPISLLTPPMESCFQSRVCLVPAAVVLSIECYCFLKPFIPAVIFTRYCAEQFTYC